jgi:glyoxylase-like metal-dependent hydrolase (beta-lactamase superfamily II)
MKFYQNIFTFLFLLLHTLIFAPYASHIESIEVIRLSDKVLVLTGVLLPAGCQVTAISSQMGIVVVDATGSLSLAQEFRQIIEKEFERNDFAYLINTHDHADHTNGNRAFADAVIIGHELCRNAMQKRKKQWTNEFISGYIPQLKKQIDQLRTRLESLPPDSTQAETVRKQISSFQRVLSDIESISGVNQDKIVMPPILTFRDKMTLDLKDMTVHLYYFGNYHSNNDIFIYVPEEGILIIGDTFSKTSLPGTSSNVRKADISLWLQVLDAVLAEPDELKHAVRGHTEILSREEIVATRDYMKELWAGIRACNDEGLSLDAIQQRFPLERFSYITKTKHQDETELLRQHTTIVQGFWRQLQNK